MPKNGKKKETKHWALVTLSSVAHIHTNTDCLYANILQVWVRLGSGQTDRRKGHRLTACNGAN